MSVYPNLTPAELQAVFDNPDMVETRADLRAERRVLKAAETVTKEFFASINKDQVTGLAPGQFTARITGPGEQIDGAGDIVVPHGAVGRDGRTSGNVVVQAYHNVVQPFARGDWRRSGSGPTASLLATITVPLGVSDYGDEVYRLVKAGIITDVSIGFEPIERERIPTGWRYTKWILCEISTVSIGCLPTAVILSKGQKMISAAHQAARDSAAELGRKGRMLDAAILAASEPRRTKSEIQATIAEMNARGRRNGSLPPARIEVGQDGPQGEALRASKHSTAVLELMQGPNSRAGRIAHAKALGRKWI